jgi:putative FmdB family regulatory protein
MPIYEYETTSPGRKCRKCFLSFEVIQSISDPPLVICPECEGSVRRKISRPRRIIQHSGKSNDDVERQIAEYEQQGMYSHAAELADKESEKPENAYLKERAMDNYQKVGYNF